MTLEWQLYTVPQELVSVVAAPVSPPGKPNRSLVMHWALATTATQWAAMLVSNPAELEKASRWKPKIPKDDSRTIIEHNVFVGSHW